MVCVFVGRTRGNESLSPYEKRNYSRSDVEIAFREDLCGEMKTKLCVIYGNRCSLALAPRVLGDLFSRLLTIPVPRPRPRPAFVLAMICLIRELDLINYLDNLCHNVALSSITGTRSLRGFFIR